MSNGLYHEDIKALAKMNSGADKLDQPDREIILDNPLCGDRVSVALKLNEGRIAAEAHEVKGCLLCRASANAIGAAAVGISAAELEGVADALSVMLKGETPESWPVSGWESLQLFQPVADHKSRHDCVLLPFKAFVQAFSDS